MEFAYYSFISEMCKKAISLFERLNTPPPAGLHRIQGLLAEYRKSQNQELTIAVFGTGKAGKSTLINNLLGLKGTDSLPVDDDPTTALPIIVRQRRHDEIAGQAIVACKSGESKIVPWTDARKLANQVEREKNHTSDEDSIEHIEYPIDRLPWPNLRIVDLPGTGTAWHTKHDKIATSFLHQSHAVFYVFSGLGSVEARDVVAGVQFADRASKNLSFVLNVRHTPGTEFTAEDQQILEAIRQEIKEQFSEQIEMGTRMFEVRGAFEPEKDPIKELSATDGWFALRKYIDDVEEQSKRIIDDKVKNDENYLKQLLRETIPSISSQVKDQKRILEESQKKSYDILLNIQMIKSESTRKAGTKSKMAAKEISENLRRTMELFLDEYFTLTGAVKGKKTLESILEKELDLSNENNWLTLLIEGKADELSADIRIEYLEEIKKLRDSSKLKDTVKENFDKRYSDLLSANSVLGDAIKKVIESAVKGAIAAAVALAFELSNPITAAATAAAFLLGFGTDPLNKERSREKAKLAQRLFKQSQRLHTDIGAHFQKICIAEYEMVAELLTEKSAKQDTDVRNICELEQLINDLGV